MLKPLPSLVPAGLTVDQVVPGPADLPWHGRVVERQVYVRRFRYANGACRRRIFAERLPEVAATRCCA